MQLLIALYLFPWLVPSTANAKLETPSTWVVVADTCKNDFARLIGETGVNEECFYFINDGNGNYFIAGKTGNNSLIVQLDPLGNIIEQRTYDFTSGDDFVASLFLDDQGFLVGSARDRINSNTTNILFKINWQTGAVIWAKTLADPAYNRFDRVFQNPANGNYWVFGMTTNAHDNFLFEVDKNAGSIEWQYVSDYGGNGDAYIGYFLTSDAVYFSGMGRLADNLYDIRPTISKFDFNGNLVWAKMHLRSPSEPSRLYNVDLIIENDTIVNCGRGSLTGEDLTVSEMLFYKTNIDGDLIWAKSYTITGGSNVAGFKVLPIPNGYIVQALFWRISRHLGYLWQG
ncbi:MAG: PQQ-like beta-propeller repeat protein [Saprospiraceae bacterium]|nr:PQQ-like beta-propeller repeat protein [Saprospiraceae bacterium]